MCKAINFILITLTVVSIFAVIVQARPYNSREEHLNRHHRSGNPQGQPCLRANSTESFVRNEENVTCICESKKEVVLFFPILIQKWNCTITELPTTTQAPTTTSTQNSTSTETTQSPPDTTQSTSSSNATTQLPSG